MLMLLKDSELNDRFKVKEFIVSLIQHFGMQSLEDILSYFQLSVNEQKRNKEIGTIIRILKVLKDKRQLVIRNYDGVSYFNILGAEYINSNSQLHNIKNSLSFVKYLIQLKNEETGMYLYFGRIRSIEIINSYPQTLDIVIDNKHYEIDYVDSYDVDTFNEISEANKESSEEKFKFLVSDNELDLDTLNYPEQYINIITVNEDSEITIIR